MMRFLLTFSLVAPLVLAQVPVFTLNCASYPEVCNTHCFAAVCSTLDGINTVLHYAPNSDTTFPNTKFPSVTEATYRRQAIGCGGSSYCKDFNGGKTQNDPSFLSCDEFPYASTYDGGLGCLKDRYPGGSSLLQRGVTHCAPLTENTAHGRAIGVFYGQQGLRNGGSFQVGFDERNVDRASLCKAIREIGSDACTSSLTNDVLGKYRKVSKPSPKSYCPARGQMRRDVSEAEEVEEHEPEFDDEPTDHSGRNVTIHSVYDSDGNKVLFFGGSKPEAGSLIWRHVEGDDAGETTYVV